MKELLSFAWDAVPFVLLWGIYFLAQILDESRKSNAGINEIVKILESNQETFKDIKSEFEYINDDMTPGERIELKRMEREYENHSSSSAS